MLFPSLAIWLATSTPVVEAIESAPGRATVWIRAGGKAVGTGWVVDKDRGWIVTARHVLADQEQAEIFFQDRHDGRPIANRNHYLSERADLRKRGRLVIGKVVAKNDNADVAVLQVVRVPKDTPSLSLSRRRAEPGCSCYSIGHRYDSELLWIRTTGTLRQLGKLKAGYFWSGNRIGVDVPLLLVQSPIEAGESGSAVLDGTGHVVGIVSAVSNRTAGLAFAVDCSVIGKLLAELRGQNLPAPVRRSADPRPDVTAALHATVWVRPRATDGRAGGVLIDGDRRLVLTTATAVGKEDIVDIVVPKWEGDRLVAEASAYQDILGLRLSGHCITGVVLARDVVRDLALVQLDDLVRHRYALYASKRAPETLRAIPLASNLRIGDHVSAVSHPAGEELLWLYSQGTVRSLGRVTLRRDGSDESKRVTASLLQLPHEGSSSGGPVVNEKGQLVGVLAAREGSRQEMGYAATPDEIRQMLKDCRWVTDPVTNRECFRRAKYLSGHGRGWLARCGVEFKTLAGPSDTVIAAYFAKLYAQFGEQYRAEQLRLRILTDLKPSPEAKALLADASLLLGEKDRAKSLVDEALRANPKLPSALVLRAELKPGKQAWADVETALTLDPQLAHGYVVRASLRDPSDPDCKQKVLADLSRAVELEPYDCDIRTRRAAARIADKQYKKAVSDCTRLKEIEPLNPRWRMELANASFLAGDRRAASQQYKAAVRIKFQYLLKVLQAVRQNGKDLQDDNPSDFERVGDWYIMALRELLPIMSGEQKDLFKEMLSQAENQTDLRKRMDLLALTIEDATGSVPPLRRK